MRQGTRRDAILYSVGANASHGLRRTNADKRRAVETLLRDEEWAAWSNREVARRCGVSPALVDDLRSSLPATGSEEPRTYTTKHGTVATMNTAAIGKAPTPPPPPPAADAFDWDEEDIPSVAESPSAPAPNAAQGEAFTAAPERASAQPLAR